MITLSLSQEAQVRQFVIKNLLASVEEIAEMTDEEVISLVQKDHYLVVLEATSAGSIPEYTTRKSFYIISKEVMDKTAILIEAIKRSR